ncbi:synaptic vesicle 2-related protein [Amyelois transitella]|uniref:synaptic vesicle 2-related protein n=1 Tax=Amyelois transitella TaxID=680683 RepID=UPI00298FCE09|nr:synaptic vesicle 2-related protein [Amyelois transitella]
MKIDLDYIETDLEEALDLAGSGKYQVFHCALMLFSLCSAMLEIVGTAFVLPAAACDLDLPDTIKGIMTSVPNIGIILTAPMWGRAADTLGRKPVLQFSSAMAGTICLLAAFMPNLSSFAICKFAGSLFLACPSSLGWAYAGELIPRGRRDTVVLICNGLLMMSSTFSPIIAWAVLSNDFRYDLGSLTLRPWRVLTIAYAVPLILTAAWTARAHESPKFLMAKGRRRQALEVLRKIYAVNTGLSWKNYCVTSLRNEDKGVLQLVDGLRSLEPKKHTYTEFLKPPHFKWLAICGFLMFGAFSLLNGLFLFAADTINRVMTDSDQEGAICLTMNQPGNTTNTCIDKISHEAFMVMLVTTVVYGVVVLTISLCPIDKRNQLTGMFVVVGVTCLVSVLERNRMVAGVAMSGLQLTSLGIGPLTAYTIHLFPTRLRGTAVGAVLMFGRLGSVVGANAAGYLLAVACTSTFYGFSVLLFACAALTFCLPRPSGTTPDGYLDTDGGS